MSEIAYDAFSTVANQIDVLDGRADYATETGWGQVGFDLFMDRWLLALAGLAAVYFGYRLATSPPDSN